jgi:hypothetical protein
MLLECTKPGEVTSKKVPKDSLEKRLPNIYYGISLRTINGPTIFTERQQFLAYKSQSFKLDFNHLDSDRFFRSRSSSRQTQVFHYFHQPLIFSREALGHVVESILPHLHVIACNQSRYSDSLSIAFPHGLCRGNCVAG